MNMDVFDRRESEVRGYIRAFPAVFTSAKGARITAEDGTEYLDFFAGAGTLNYGHNNENFKQALLDYIVEDGIVHGLDMATSAKRAFLEAFEQHILEPRGLDYRVQFTGPTGANTVEAALKLARIATGRSNVIAFTNAFHGVSLGAVSATAGANFRKGAGVDLGNVTRMPYDGYLGADFDTLDLLEKMLDDASGGVDHPAAVIVETVQGEGGINVASSEWLQRLRTLTKERGILLIADDIQVGVGRTGKFFSWEEAGIVPDLVTLSKSIGGYGLPMALLLIRSDLDVWKPGQHSGTFRGLNLAFVAARRAIETYWADTELERHIAKLSETLREGLESIVAEHPKLELEVRGRGLVFGIESKTDRAWAGRMSKEAFKNGLIIECAGADDQVLKFLPPLVIDEADLKAGIDLLARAARSLAEVKS
ncbi:diaminobutyrate--2-oxoglutarate transaminase [Gulosibacter faecalis]|jgi:diaminobutyrate-2-oxoglutarate transaminase|uniref:Diaminobutyrate--2-oxoglutarate transaminase n=1 Tax=Gulosibacter faecalis TaxID=272240 RepID=A0ABW5UW65_9MICO|nr:diaminobutyrate--2-oxoglutarate transaminase [Gulosibacter faecalis]